jgi:hypothetical protein
VSWPQALADYVEDSLTEYGAAYTRAMLPQLVSIGLESGLSGRQMLTQMRAAGYKVGNQYFYSVLGQVNQASSREGAWSAMDPTVTPAESDFVEWNVARGTGYMYRFEVLVTDSAGAQSWLPRGMKTPFPIASGELMQDLADYYSSIPDEFAGGDSDLNFQGIRLTGLYKLVPGP